MKEEALIFDTVWVVDVDNIKRQEESDSDSGESFVSNVTPPIRSITEPVQSAQKMPELKMLPRTMSLVDSRNKMKQRYYQVGGYQVPIPKLKVPSFDLKSLIISDEDTEETSKKYTAQGDLFDDCCEEDIDFLSDRIEVGEIFLESQSQSLESEEQNKTEDYQAEQNREDFSDQETEVDDMELDIDDRREMEIDDVVDSTDDDQSYDIRASEDCVDQTLDGTMFDFDEAKTEETLTSTAHLHTLPNSLPMKFLTDQAP
eukprot:GHVP01027982.1.p1 GENE.GHVP01027982.1~~GHVP01027982.1.p1  ORF type:complete len:258 (+),score=62.88 GHVP01027982.1:36-809(+)